MCSKFVQFDTTWEDHYLPRLVGESVHDDYALIYLKRFLTSGFWGSESDQ